MYKILIILIICIVVIYNFTSNKKDYKNMKRHLTNEYHYAHFSQITKDNWYLTSSYLLTSPRTIYLKEGESLWIPKGWWHWIESLGPSIAINFWSEKSNYKMRDEPHKLYSTYQTDKVKYKIKEYLKNKNQINIWNSEIDEIRNEELKDKDMSYIISLPGYRTVKDKLNLELFKYIDKDIKVPDIFDKNKVDKNFWISLGYHDTGLHYDDYFGLLCVLEGEKKVTLYPPSDSVYLKPYSVVPLWALSNPIEFEYNTYTFVSELDDKSNFPSSRLLYESIMALGNKDILKTITMVSSRIFNKVVWGCKLKDGKMRWELYMYHYLPDLSNNKNEELIKVLIENNDDNDRKSLYEYNKECMNKDLIIHSFDINLDSNPVDSDVHLYYKAGGYSKPFFGYGKTILRDGSIEFESNYVLDEQVNFYNNFEEYTKTIKAKNVKNCKELLKLYKCKDICIFSKNQDEIFIMYIGISLHDFIKFLNKYNYPDSLINHVKENKDKYMNIKHEITIVFNKRTLNVIRTAFYGVL
jgi:hypothetical protein